MAEKRMFSKQIIDSDCFLDMPLSTQALYFHLSMRADDDGFLNCAKKIMRMIGTNQNDYDLLVAKKYILEFPDGICVIKHWRINNYIRGDRYKKTAYQDEMSMLYVKENGSYTLDSSHGIPCGIPIDDTDKNRLDKNSIDKNSIDINSTFLEERKEIISYLNEKLGTKYKYNAESTKKHINARLNEGYTVDDFKEVIDKKCKEWVGNPKMEEYLRPRTLFSNKFEDYLQQKEKESYNVQRKQTTRADFIPNEESYNPSKYFG